MSLLLSWTVTLFTHGPALEETKMPEHVSVHKMSDETRLQFMDC